MSSGNANPILASKLRQNERLYQKACAIFCGSPHVFRYYDSSSEVSADLLTVSDAPRTGIVSYSTLGLSHHPLGLREGGKPLRVEIAAACSKEFEDAPYLLSSCAFDAMNSRFLCCRGSVRQGVITTYWQNCRMKHLWLVPKNLWGNSILELSFEEINVIWLTAIGISDQELHFLEHNDSDSLLALFEKKETDLCDWMRESVL